MHQAAHPSCLPAGRRARYTAVWQPGTAAIHVQRRTATQPLPSPQLLQKHTTRLGLCCRRRDRYICRCGCAAFTAVATLIGTHVAFSRARATGVLCTQCTPAVAPPEHGLMCKGKQRSRAATQGCTCGASCQQTSDTLGADMSWRWHDQLRACWRPGVHLPCGGVMQRCMCRAPSC